MRLGIYQGLFLLYKFLQTSAEQCTSETFRINPDKRDVKLQGFTFRTFEKISPRACFQKCIRRKRCHSYNYNRASLSCEINLNPVNVLEGDFQVETGYVYVEVDHYRGDPLYDPCVGNQCARGEVCTSLQNKKFVCISEDNTILNKETQNVALGKLSGESSSYTDYTSESALDGLTHTFSHTQKEINPFWWVDLGNIYNIRRIEIINRPSFGSRLHDLDIAVGQSRGGMSIFAHFTGPGKDGEHLVFQRNRYTDGRFVNLTITNGGEYLQLAEVMVFAYPIY